MIKQIFLYIVLIISLFVSTTEGYYKENSNNEIAFFKLSTQLAENKREIPFLPVIYRNDCIINNNYLIVGGYNKYLNPIIEIEVINIQRYNKTNSDESGLLLEKLVYANIRLQQLINELNELNSKEKALEEIVLDEESQRVAKRSKQIIDELNQINNRINDTLFDNRVSTISPQNNAKQEFLIENENKEKININDPYVIDIINDTIDPYELRERDIKHSYSNRRIEHNINDQMPPIFQSLFSLIEYFENNKGDTLILVSIAAFFCFCFFKILKKR